MKNILLIFTLIITNQLFAQKVDTLGFDQMYLDYAKISSNEKYIGGRIARTLPIIFNLEEGTDTVFNAYGIIQSVSNNGMAVGRFLNHDNVNIYGEPFDQAMSYNMNTNEFNYYGLPEGWSMGSDQAFSSITCYIDELGEGYGMVSGATTTGDTTYTRAAFASSDVAVTPLGTEYDEYYSNIYDAKYVNGRLYQVGWQETASLPREPAIWVDGENIVEVPSTFNGETYGINDNATYASIIFSGVNTRYDIATGDTSVLSPVKNHEFDTYYPLMVDNSGKVYGHKQGFGIGGGYSGVVWITPDSAIFLQQYLLTKGIIFENYQIDRILDVTPNGNVIIFNAVDQGGLLTTFMVTLDNTIASAPVEEKVIDEVAIYPNPVVDVINISLNSSESTDAQINIYNTSGQLIQQLSGNQIFPGQQTIQIPSHQLDSGVYLLEIRSNENSSVVKFTK